MSCYINVRKFWQQQKIVGRYGNYKWHWSWRRVWLFTCFAFLFCKLVERQNAKPFFMCVLCFKCVICIFSLLSSFKLVENFQPYQKLMCMHFMFQMCMPMCICIYIFSRFHIYWKISKCSIFYMLHCPPCAYPQLLLMSL